MPGPGERQAGKLWIPIFIIFGLTRPGIEPESTASVADALSTRPLIVFSSSPERVNFFGAQSSLGGGGRPRNAPPWRRAVLMGTRCTFQRSGSSSFELLLAEGDSVERSDRNVLQGTFCFQLSTAFPFYCYIPFTEVESSRTHFEVLSLKASSSRKLPFISTRGQQYFWNPLKFCRSFFVK